jgi:hypothetical protein
MDAHCLLDRLNKLSSPILEMFFTIAKLEENESITSQCEASRIENSHISLLLVGTTKLVPTCGYFLCLLELALWDVIEPFANDDRASPQRLFVQLVPSITVNLGHLIGKKSLGHTEWIPLSPVISRI